MVLLLFALSGFLFFRMYKNILIISIIANILYTNLYLVLFFFWTIQKPFWNINIKLILVQAGGECTLVSEIAKARQHIKNSLERVS